MTRNPYGCNLCGMTFRTAIAEARHRHNAPTMCSRKGLARIGIYSPEAHRPVPLDMADDPDLSAPNTTERDK